MKLQSTVNLTFLSTKHGLNSFYFIYSGIIAVLLIETGNARLIETGTRPTPAGIPPVGIQILLTRLASQRHGRTRCVGSLR